MEKIPFVTLDELTTARKIERMLLTFPQDLGIVFVGCEVKAYINDPTMYFLKIGVTGSIDSQAVSLAAGMIISKEFSGINYSVEVFIGKTKNELTK